MKAKTLDSRMTDRLAHELQLALRGDVRFDAGSRALYATDASNYRQVPIGVVIPKDKRDIIETVAICRSFGVPLLSRGGGTSLAGQCCNVAVVMDMSQYYNHILTIDAASKTARIQPGLVLDHLRAEAGRYGLTFGPDPATHNHCTLGGMIGNNSCGTHSVMAGKTVDNVISLEILTYDGEHFEVGETSDAEYERIVQEGGRKAAMYRQLRRIRETYAPLIRERYPLIPRRVSGYNLDQLLPENGFHIARALTGTESTCVTILEATVRLVEDPKARSLVVLGYPSIFEAADHVPAILKSKPIALEGVDNMLAANMKKQKVHLLDLKLLPPGKGWLLVEFGGPTRKDSDAQALELIERLKDEPNPPSIKLYDDDREEKHVWEIREGGLGATAFVPGQDDTWEGWEDSAVAPEKLGAYLRDLRQIYERYGYFGAMYGHFGQGCLHTRINFNLVTPKGIQTFRAFLEEATDLIVRYGGSYSGEHGDGQSKAAFLPKMFGQELIQAFREFKTVWDPGGYMNPGKIVDPYDPTQNLRLGTDYNPLPLETHFQFPSDQGDFARAALRCVGVGKCRRQESGTMCPSYMVTLEEKHSTRGRAHLLFEMMQGDVLKGGWKEPAVKDALDLCLSCKGCKGDCPVSVDMATYKAEFLSHFYEGRFRPIAAYAMGRIMTWARLASRIPRLANFISQTPWMAGLLKRVAGIASERRIPAFATQTFKAWFHERTDARTSGPVVLLWPDTFNNYFHPQVARAAVAVLEDAGCQVQIPEGHLCCGRPLYDYGWLVDAKFKLREILEMLRPQIRQGVPLIGLEPSCTAVFRDELTELFPHDQDAQRLKQQTFLLSEFLVKKGYRPNTLTGKALIQKHCHHEAVMKFTDEEEILHRTGLDLEIPDSGCCGMAGSFGFEKDHYKVSRDVGERVLLPKVRRADPQTLILADGFSCREQIGDLTGKSAMHLAEVLERAIREGGPPLERRRRPREVPVAAK
jgi:FAD/FMN-containing dehydrogenase/Fe-S oxidoreductase